MGKYSTLTFVVTWMSFLWLQRADEFQSGFVIFDLGMEMSSIFMAQTNGSGKTFLWSE